MKMRKCFEITCGTIDIADEENLIFDIDEGRMYTDINGHEVPKKDEYIVPDCDDLDPWDDELLQDDEYGEGLISDSTVEIDWEASGDGFGNFGFKNKNGVFVIEPQYAFAWDFTNGLASVNLKRTWYRTTDGERFYENHYGYINKRGETVIPFSFHEAYPFNKYGVAVVYRNNHVGILIDMTGNVIPGTEKLDFIHYYNYGDRYLRFVIRNEDFCNDDPEGIYDTKLRKVLLNPSIQHFREYDEENICITEVHNSDQTYIRKYFINSKGEKIYKWLQDKCFADVGKPNKSLLSIVGSIINIEVVNKASNYHLSKDTRAEKRYIYGVYSSDERFEIPMEYERIEELSENIFACRKNRSVSIFKYE